MLLKTLFMVLSKIITIGWTTLYLANMFLFQISRLLKLIGCSSLSCTPVLLPNVEKLYVSNLELKNSALTKMFCNRNL